MIVDVHTHVGEIKHYNKFYLEESLKMRMDTSGIATTLDEHWEAMKSVDKAIVLAYRSDNEGVNIPNDYVASYVKEHKEKLIGFMALDPNDTHLVEEMERSFHVLKLKGIKISAIDQAFHPMDERMMAVYEFAEKNGLPILTHCGTTFARVAPLKYGNPILFEDVAYKFPDLKLIMAHMGHPWGEDTMALIRKQPNIYADVSALIYRPYQLYNFMITFSEWGVLHKLLFGSDFPVATPKETIDGLLKVNDIVEGSKLPKVPLDEIENIIHRSSLKLLNLE